MRHLLYLILLTVISQETIAQNSGLYRGGKGGGGASVSVAIGNGQPFNLSVSNASGTHLVTIKQIPYGKIYRLSVYDCLGRKLETVSLPANTAQYKLTKTYARGLYMAVAEVDGRSLVQKFVLQ